VVVACCGLELAGLPINSIPSLAEGSAEKHMTRGSANPNNVAHGYEEPDWLTRVVSHKQYTAYFIEG
jgi:hypothetical protein